MNERGRSRVVAAGIFASGVVVAALATFFISFNVVDAEFVSCPTGGDILTRYPCWDKAIQQDLRTRDTAHTLAQLKFFLVESPDFVQTCHSLAHKVGEEAYRRFSNNESMQASPDTQVCDFGFYHGFMTIFLTESREYTKLGEVCTTLKDSNINGALESSRWACFHGIGHGSIAEYPASDWERGGYEPLTETLAICRAAAQREDDYVRCAAGAYNSMSYGEYRLMLDPKDPYKLCRQVPDSYVPAECYANLASNVFNLTSNKTILEAVGLASTYTPHEYLLRIIPTFANMASRKLAPAEEFTCTHLAAEQVAPCLSGFISGLVQLESPETKQKSAFAFCASDVVPPTLRADCYAHTLSMLSQFWGKERVEASCDMVVDRDKALCEAAKGSSV